MCRDCLNFQPTEPCTLENLVGLAQQELLQHDDGSAMFDLYENEDLLTGSSVGSGSLTLSSNLGGFNYNNKIMKLDELPHTGYISRNDHLIMEQDDSLCKTSNSSHMFLDFSDHSQPIFSTKDFEKNVFNREVNKVDPYVDMTRK